VADGDASENTIRSYHTNAGQFVNWCASQDIQPAAATETDLQNYRKNMPMQSPSAAGTMAWIAVSTDCGATRSWIQEPRNSGLGTRAGAAKPHIRVAERHHSSGGAALAKGYTTVL